MKATQAAIGSFTTEVTKKGPERGESTCSTLASTTTLFAASLKMAQLFRPSSPYQNANPSLTLLPPRSAYKLWLHGKSSRDSALEKPSSATAADRFSSRNYWIIMLI